MYYVLLYGFSFFYYYCVSNIPIFHRFPADNLADSLVPIHVAKKLRDGLQSDSEIENHKRVTVVFAEVGEGTTRESLYLLRGVFKLFILIARL